MDVKYTKAVLILSINLFLMVEPIFRILKCNATGNQYFIIQLFLSTLDDVGPWYSGTELIRVNFAIRTFQGLYSVLQSMVFFKDFG